MYGTFYVVKDKYFVLWLKNNCSVSKEELYQYGKNSIKFGGTMSDLKEEKFEMENAILKARSDMPGDVLTYQPVYSIPVPSKIELVTYDNVEVKRMVKVCKKYELECFDWSDLFLTISSLSGGAIFGAIASGIPYRLTLNSVMFYNVFPIIFSSSLIAYWFFKKRSKTNAKEILEKVKEFLESGNIIKDGEKDDN